MNDTDKIRRLLNSKINQATRNFFYGTIESVDSDKRTAKVKSGAIIYEDVLLFAAEKSDLKGFVVLPKKGSVVLVAKVASGRYFVVMQSDTDVFKVEIGDKTSLKVSETSFCFSADKTKIEADQNGFSIEKESAGLKKTLEALCDAISKMTVTTGIGPSGTPINVADFIQIKQELNKYLK